MNVLQLMWENNYCSYFTAQNSPPVEFVFKLQLSALVKDWLFITNTGKIKEKLFIETKHAIYTAQKVNFSQVIIELNLFIVFLHRNTVLVPFTKDE